MSDEPKSAMPLLRTIGGSVVAITSAVIAVILVLRGAPLSAWVTALMIGLVAATIVEPTMLADWVLRRRRDDP